MRINGGVFMNDEKVESPSNPSASSQRVSQIETSHANAGEADEKKNGRNQRNRTQLTASSRRSFLGRAGGLTAMAMAASIVPLEPLLRGKESEAEASVITYTE